MDNNNNNSSNKKYKIRYDLRKVIDGGRTTLYQIEAIRSFGNVCKGDLGGYIRCEDNLSHRGECWVEDDAMVYGYAHISDKALIGGTAKVFGNACIYGKAFVSGKCQVFGNAKVYGGIGGVGIFGSICAYGYANITVSMVGHIWVYGPDQNVDYFVPRKAF